MKKVFLSVIAFIAIHSFSQTRMDIGRVGSNTMGQITFYDVEGNGLPYSKIKGSPLWRDEWTTANLFSADGKSYGIYQAKLNLATNEVLYLDKNGDTWATQSVTKIIFYTGRDTSTVLTAFSTGKPYLVEKSYKDDFLQILNHGNNQLLKIVKRTVGTADSMFNTLKRYYFKNEIIYYLYTNGKTDRLKKLGKTYLLEHLPGSVKCLKWAEENNIRFYREEDVVKFIEYYNSMEK